MKTLAIALLSLFAANGIPAAFAQTTLRYTFISKGKPSGSEVDTFTGNTIESHFEFNDRGRGPKIVARYTINPAGLPIATDITGNDYLKAPVDEHFSTANGASHWKSTSEDGQSTAIGFYLSNNGPAIESALLVAALVKANKAPIALLPAGQVQLERLADANLEATIDGNPQKMHVTDYAITGLSFAPATLWLDDDLHYFGNPGTWGAILREGWESSNDQLNAIEQRSNDTRFARLATELSVHPTTPIAFEHVRLFDSEHATTLPDQTVLVEGDRITQVGPSSSTPAPANAQQIDGTGKTLLPGLFDMHAHAQAGDGILNIASGVTTIRDMGNSIEDLSRLQQQWDVGSAIGPRIWKAGLIDGPGPFQAPTGLLASTPEEAAKDVNRYADLGYIQIKLYSSLKPELVPGIIALAHQRGLRVSGHIPDCINAAQFVEEGADEIQHINFVFLNFITGSNMRKDALKPLDTRTPQRFTLVGETAAGLDLNSKPVLDFLALLKAHHTTVDVTLATFEGMFTGRAGKVTPDMAPILTRLPAQVQRGAYTGGLPVVDTPGAPNNAKLYADSYANMLKMTKRLYDAGIPILAGTDATAGLYLHRELELEVQAGIPAAKALQIATWNAAHLLKQPELGFIAAGNKADLVLVEGNPADNISDIRRTRQVLKNGVLFSSAELYRSSGIQPAN